jgi:ppGpp synthetase/RelA/SpoT-type nucleotidyltranferase
MQLPKDCSPALASLGAIDRSGEGYREDPSNYVALRRIQCYRLFRVSGLDAFLDAVVQALPDERIVMGARLKRLPSIVRKLEREREMRLSRMADILGLRILCSSIRASDRVIKSLQASPHFRRMLDYRQAPRDTGYRACHLIFRLEQFAPSGNVIRVEFEIQVRTFYQHLWSLVSESMGEQVKEGAGPKTARDYLASLSVAILARENEQPEELQETFSEVGQARDLLLVRMRAGRQIAMLPFGTHYDRAVLHMLAWEEDLNDGPTETLLLLGVGNLKSLGRTHATFLGMTSIPLPDWMPQV